MSHTPGPWTATHSYGGNFSLDAEDGTLIVGGCGCCGSPFMEGKNHEADASLIAAAPDLLAALRIAAAFMGIASDWNIDEAEINGEMKSTYDWLDIVKAAIAKATGEQQ